MAKFRGKIGFVELTETAPGVISEYATERTYSGDIIRNIRRFENSGNVNDNVLLNNIFSIVGDTYAFGNIQNMKYVSWMSVLWKITNIEIQRPRLVLTVGGVYNGSIPAPDEEGTAPGAP